MLMATPRGLSLASVAVIFLVWPIFGAWKVSGNFLRCRQSKGSLNRVGKPGNAKMGSANGRSFSMPCIPEYQNSILPGMGLQTNGVALSDRGCDSGRELNELGSREMH